MSAATGVMNVAVERIAGGGREVFGVPEPEAAERPTGPIAAALVDQARRPAVAAPPHETSATAAEPLQSRTHGPIAPARSALAETVSGPRIR